MIAALARTVNKSAVTDPGFVHVSPEQRWSEFALAHESGHFLHHLYGRDGSYYYGRFSEPMAHVHGASGLKVGWRLYGEDLPAENFDYNGKKAGGVVSQADMNFYASPADPTIPPYPTDCSQYVDPNDGKTKWNDYCCDSDPNDGVEDTVEYKHICKMVESQGWYWRIFYDLADGIGNEPESFGQGEFDQVGGWSTNPLDDQTIDVVLNYLGGG